MAAKLSAERRQQERLRRAYERGLQRLRRLGAGGRPWFRRDDGARLAHDAALLKQYGFHELRHEVRGRTAVLTGSIALITGESGIVRRIDTEIRFPDAYPRHEPAAFDIAQRFKALPGLTLADRHLGADGWCCLWLPSRSEWDGRDPNALGHYLRQLAIFFERQLICDVIGRWPGPQWSHGEAGFAEDIRETLDNRDDIIGWYQLILRGQTKPRRRDTCPCGSGNAFLTCHKPIFDGLTERMPAQLLRKIRCGEIGLLKMVESQ